MKRIDQLRSMWWEWADATPNPRQRLPTVIQFPVNDICNSKCQMCHIWQRKRAHEVTPAELSTILQNPLFREVRDVGINGGEPTLRKDLPDLVDVMIQKLPRLRGLTMITNAIQEANVVKASEEIGARCSRASVHLTVMVSLDGIGSVHDRVRGVEGNFASAVRVLDRLAESPVIGSCLIGCTLIRENVYNAEQVLAFARSKAIYARFRVGIPHRRLYTLDLTEPFAFDQAEKYHLACFLDELRFNYEKDPIRKAFYLSLRNQIIEDAPRAAGCAWKNRGVTLTSRGELAYCAVESPILGSLLTEPADDLYWGRADALKEINATRCHGCLHDYTGLQDRRLWWERAAKSWLPRLPGGAMALNTARNVYIATRDRSASKRARLARPALAENVPRAGRDAILVCGWYGTETLGDKAILSGLLTSLRAGGWTGAVDLVSLEPYVSRQTQREMPELCLRSILPLEQARQKTANAEYRLVAIGGGPLMSPIAEVYELLSLFTNAAATNTGRAIMGCGIGPLGSSTRRDTAIAELLERSELTILRDRASLDVARTSLGFTGEATVAADPAFIWAGRQFASKPHPTRSNTVLLALREWQIHEYALGLSTGDALRLKSDFENELIEMVDELGRLAPDWKLRPVAMHTHARGGDDRLFVQRLFAERPSVLEAMCWKRVSPAEEFSSFCSARAVVAMRFHSAVLAIAAGTPHAVIDYTRGGKVAALLSSVNSGAPRWSLESFAGKECARQLIEAAGRQAPPAPAGVEEAYTSAWQRALSRTGD